MGKFSISTGKNGVLNKLRKKYGLFSLYLSFGKVNEVTFREEKTVIYYFQVFLFILVES